MSKKLSRTEKRERKQAKKDAKLQKLKEKSFPDFPEPIKILEPQIAKYPTEEKIPKNIQNPDIYKTMTVDFYLDSKDVVGKWSWGLERDRLNQDYASIIEPFLEHPKTTKWGTLEGERYGRQCKTKHHYIYVTRLLEEIQQRWNILALDYPEVFTFRLSGKKRLWGYRVINKYYIVWWDPEHEIWPL